MIKDLQLRVLPEVAGQADELLRFLAKSLNLNPSQIRHIETVHRSIDARQKIIYFNLTVRVFIEEEFVPRQKRDLSARNVKEKEEILIIGAGPAGLFAAIELIEQGFKPILLERGKDVKERIQDLRGINVHHIVNEDSNYCFGEGGAGTYSDGKLYTRSKKRGNVTEILELLVTFGASEDILIDAHPHIGTNKLPDIIRNMREYIIQCGGEVKFNTRVTDLLLNGNQISGILTKEGERYHCNKVILATGHSARDIFELLVSKNIKIELKPIAIGVRVEHAQSLIDRIQYKCETRGKFLPPSPYNVVKQIGDRGVYSFCMCPGGVIAPCATKPGEIVTNGWSSSARARPTANSGIVVELKLDDFKPFQSSGTLAAMAFQQAIEVKAWEAGGKTQTAPAQRLLDFVEGKTSLDLPKTSYSPGIVSVSLKEILPKLIHDSLVKGFKEFNKNMKGYLTNDAVVHAPETRTSSPVKIPRDEITLEHVQIRGLYPSGEGAGYAGGIISAAMDGIKVARAIGKN
ncbi:FAD-binding protein [Leptospira ognonensis]|uniref:FAD-binding protein n=1 Tax=Leptospira ognonensis TaxID=2484945 RepID=A0A4R9K6G0_9LEPT|nr:NAD(P)/FAD-dependent oxidoreductase [Leptospira ognonensis]TGL60157.1 FAD-binding protein [Leptospira ognonensis]